MTTVAQRIGADQVQRYNTGKGVRVGVLYKGISGNPSHVKGGYDFINNAPRDSNQGVQTMDTKIIAIAPGAYIYDMRVMTADGIVSAPAVKAALDWAVTNRIEVLFLGFGITWSQELDDALTSAYNAGIVLVAPAGGAQMASLTDRYGFSLKYDINRYAPQGNTMFPANHSKVVAVGALHINDEDLPYYLVPIWDSYYQTYIFRTYSHFIDGKIRVVAPWHDPDGVNFFFDNDTGASAAYVAGVVALIIASGQFTTPATITQRLYDTATDKLSPVDVSGFDVHYGYGLVNALLAAPPKSLEGLDILTQKFNLGIGASGTGDSSKVGGLLAQLLTIRVPDVIPYVGRYTWPRDGETLVPVGNPIVVLLKSDGPGINIDKVKIKINGTTYQKGDAGFTFTGDRRVYTVTVKPTAQQPWAYESTVAVEIEAEELDGTPGLIYERFTS